MYSIPEELMSLLVDITNVLYDNQILSKKSIPNMYDLPPKIIIIMSKQYMNRKFKEEVILTEAMDRDHIYLGLRIMRFMNNEYFSDECLNLVKGTTVTKKDLKLPICVKSNSIIGDNLIFIDRLMMDLKLKMLELI